MEVTLGNQGIRELKKFFQRKLNTLDTLVENIELALAEKGFQLLQTNAPTHDIDGNRVGSASIEKYADGYRVVYSGEDVAYIEFGTGYKGANDKYPNPTVLTFWQYDINGHGAKGWYYKSKQDGSIRHSQGGMYPEKPVYKAYTELEQIATSVIEGVLDDFFA